MLELFARLPRTGTTVVVATHERDISRLATRTVALCDGRADEERRPAGRSGADGMTAPWRKVLRDVWRERTRALLVVTAIAIGLAGFLAVLSTYAILRRELNRGYLATNPASAVLVTDAIDEALLASIVARDDVSDADARRVLRGRSAPVLGSGAGSSSSSSATSGISASAR